MLACDKLPGCLTHFNSRDKSKLTTPPWHSYLTSLDLFCQLCLHSVAVNIKLLCLALHKHGMDVSYIYHQSQVCCKPGYHSQGQGVTRGRGPDFKDTLGHRAHRQGCSLLLISCKISKLSKLSATVFSGILRHHVESTIVRVGRM